MNSRLVEKNREYTIQTTNDIGMGSISSEVFVNGALADATRLPHPEQAQPEEVLALVKSTHDDKKQEVETLLKSYVQAMENSNPEMMYHLGLALYYKRFFSEARDLFASAVTMKDDYHEAHNLLGQAELSLGHPGQAVKAAEAAVTARSGYADYRNNLGEAFMAAGELSKAQAEFAKAIDINLYYSDAYFNYGLALLVEAQREDKREVLPNLVTKAIDYFNKAALIYPDYRTAGYERGLQAVKGREVREGFQLLRAVRQNKKETHGTRYASYYMKHALHPQWITERIVQERIEFLQKEISKNPTYVDLYAELSRCYLEQSRMLWRKGIDQYRKTLEINPGLDELDAILDSVEDTYERIDRVVRNISEKG